MSWILRELKAWTMKASQLMFFVELCSTVIGWPIWHKIQLSCFAISFKLSLLVWCINLGVSSQRSLSLK